MPLIVCVCRLSNFGGELRKTRDRCSRVRYGSSRSSKVVDVGTSSKRLYDFLLVINTGPYLAPFLRYGDLLADNRQFSLPLSDVALSMRVTPFEFLETFIILILESFTELSVKIS